MIIPNKALSVLTMFICIAILTNCASLRRLVIKEAFPTITATERAILAEENEELVHQSLPFAIKLTEGIYATTPNSNYAAKLSLLYAAYAFAFVDKGPYSDFDEEGDKEILASRRLYQKSFNYGVAALGAKVKNFETLLLQPDKVDELLAQIKVEQTEALFWLSFSWAMLLFSDLSDITILPHVETIRKLAHRVIELNENYYYGAAYAILMAYYGARSTAIGGDKTRAQEYYTKAKALSATSSIIPYYVYMRFIAIEQADQAGFETAYNVITTYDIQQNKDIAFIHVFIKRKAQTLYAKRDLFF